MQCGDVEPLGQLLVVGCGGHARFVLSMVNCSPYSAAGLIDQGDDFDRNEVIMSVPVIGCESQMADLRNRFDKAVIAVGDNQRRMVIYQQLTALGYHIVNIIHPSAFVDPACRMGQGNIVGPNAVIGAEVSIGDNNIINTAAVIEHQSSVGSHCHLGPGATVCGAVKVDDEVLLGANCTVLAQVAIAQGTILGAGATMIRSQSEPHRTLVGSPAKELSR